PLRQRKPHRRQDRQGHPAHHHQDQGRQDLHHRQSQRRGPYPAGGASHRTDFDLTTKDKPWETAADFHRFKVAVPAGKTVPFTVSEERIVSSNVSLTNLDDQNIRIFMNAPVTSPKVKDALTRVLTLRGR